MRKAKHVRRELTDAERARVEEARQLVQKDEAEIRGAARQYKQEYDAAQATLQEALQLLKAERLRQGLSLADIQDRAGIERPNLSRLENDTEANPTVATLTRYAKALGKKLVISLSD
jgi:DNA-binding phage protein